MNTSSAPVQGENATIHKKKSSFKSYLWILSFLKPYAWMVSGFIMLSLFVIGVELAVPKFLQYFIDILIPAKNFRSLFGLLAVLAGLIVLMIAATLFRTKLQRIMQENAAKNLQIALFHHLRKLGFSYYERNPIGETLSLFNSEVKAVQQIYTHYFPGLVITGITFAASAIIMVTIHPFLSLVVIPCFLSYYLLGPYYERKAAELGREAQSHRTVYHKKLYDTVSALLELRVYRSKEWDTEQAHLKQAKMNNTVNKLHYMSYMRGLVRRVSVQWGAVAVFAYGTYLLSQNQVSTGALVAFLFYYYRMMADITFMVSMTTEQKVLMNQVERLFDFINEQPDVVENEAPKTLSIVEGNLSFKQVYFHYPRQNELIQNFTLDIRSGERIAFVGTSGSGKSTLLKLIGRFYDPKQGEVLLDGIPLKQLSLKQVRESMGFVFQETYLFGTTIKENIRFGQTTATDADVMEAAKAAYAHDFIQEFPDGYDTLVGERGVKLSGGQRQRISLARMFIKNPRILVLDEATSALDNVSEWEVQQALHKLFIGRTTISIAHRLSTIKDFDRIVVVEQGAIAEIGTYADLLMRRSAFTKLAEGEEKQSIG